jgi:hypothetical protein
MSLLCKLIDHKDGNVSTRKEIEERNGQKISVKIQTTECSRCGHTKEDRVRTIIEPGEYDEDLNNEEQEQQKNERVTDIDDVSDSETDNLDTSENKSNERIYHKDVSDEKNKNHQRKNISTTKDEGVIILKQNENRTNDGNGDDLISKSPSNPVNVSCTDCDYNSVDEENHRRSGDFCPECSGWLKIEK